MRIEKQMLNNALRVLGKAVYQTSPVELYRSVTNETGFSCGECPYVDRCKKWSHFPSMKCLNHSGTGSE